MDLPSLADLRPALLRQRDTTDPKRQERLDNALKEIFEDYGWERPENLAAVQVLLAAGANPDARHTGRGEENGKTITQYLVETLDEKDYEAKAPFIMALLAAGVDPNEKLSYEGYRGETVYYTLSSNLVQFAKPDMVRALIKAGADVNTMFRNADRKDNRKDYNVILMLIAAGADVNQRDSDGKTPLSNLLYEVQRQYNPDKRYWGDVVWEEVLRAAGATE